MKLPIMARGEALALDENQMQKCYDKLACEFGMRRVTLSL
jgi:hypothetical protein